jgi:hypothetical protein
LGGRPLTVHEKVFAGLREFLEHALDGYENKPNVVVPMRAGADVVETESPRFQAYFRWEHQQEVLPPKGQAKGKVSLSFSLFIFSIIIIS